MITKIVTIARYNLVRMFRERANLFFVLVFPIAIIAVIGTQFAGEDTPEVGLVGTGDLAERTADRLEDTGAADVRRVDTAADLRDLVVDETLPAGIVVPDDAEAVLRDGRTLEPVVMLGSGEDAAQLEGVLTRAVEAEAVVPRATGELVSRMDASPEEASSVVAGMAEALPAVEIERVLAGGGDPDEEEYGIDQVAVGMLLLMTFLNALTGAASLIQSRKHGVSRRMMGTPTSLRTIVIGEGAGRWSVGMFQALYIMVASALIFGVTWGDIPAAVVVLVLFAAVAAGAAMLVGAVMHNDEQAAGVTVMVGLGLGALGGTMLPLELFGSTMNTVAHFTPHAWAIDAFTELTRRGGTVADILPELGVLAAFAVVLFALAAWRLRLTLTRL
ncbi:ABC transporter permease [Phytoactinopolyspora halotolerans]|uniref:ABC transporter permease n=1 Tax=Phytoactinopolyspora halotolerans TaxID=1981512 RepID=A0A6L9SBT2_9ACTN|nr:ABC transporter permease [Phytoactinopolyspora halotolerans]NEE02533.1 ABC transporter permease [Phytoactinopolyspora halotolerans]